MLKLNFIGPDSYSPTEKRPDDPLVSEKITATIGQDSCSPTEKRPDDPPVLETSTAGASSSSVYVDMSSLQKESVKSFPIHQANFLWRN
jgi:hypothetical protein